MAPEQTPDVSDVADLHTEADRLARTIENRLGGVASKIEITAEMERLDGGLGHNKTRLRWSYGRGR